MKNVKKLNEEPAAFRELPDESLDAVAGGGDGHDHKHNDGIGLDVLFGGPDHLFQFALGIAQELAHFGSKALDSGLHSGHKARLFLGFVCHDAVRLSYLVSR